jgi:hypothetical protein
MAAIPAQEIQEEFLSTVRKSQETVLEAIHTWVETVQSMTPKLPNMQMPFTDHLPKPEDVVAGAYDFAEALLRDQRKFSEDVIKATSPLLPGDSKGMPAPRTPAQKASAK